jgi:hypothetical protein
MPEMGDSAIVLWNNVYWEPATQALRHTGRLKGDFLPRYLASLGWEHINLTGDYVLRQSRKIDEGHFRVLRTPEKPLCDIFSVSPALV